jgi:hypothetical protein
MKKTVGNWTIEVTVPDYGPGGPGFTLKHQFCAHTTIMPMGGDDLGSLAEDLRDLAFVVESGRRHLRFRTQEKKRLPEGGKQ